MFDKRPDPNKNWNKDDLKRFESLMTFMNATPGFKDFFKKRESTREQKRLALKLKSTDQLEKQASELKRLLKSNFERLSGGAVRLCAKANGRYSLAPLVAPPFLYYVEGEGRD